MSDSDFNFEDFEKEFKIDFEAEFNKTSGRAPRWSEIWLASMKDDPPEAVDEDGEIVVDSGEGYEKWIKLKLDKLIKSQKMGKFEIEVLSGEMDEERGGYGLDSEFEVRFNGALCMTISRALKMAVTALQMKVAMEAAMRGTTPDQIVDREGTSLQDEVDLLDGFAWLLVDVGTGRVDKVELPEKEV